MYRATTIAKWFVNKGIEDNSPLTPMQVLKLAYIAQGAHLAMYNEPLFGESCEAWRYGPVVPIIYQKTKEYGRSPIAQDVFKGVSNVSNDDDETLKILNSVWKHFGTWNGSALSEWTHRTGSAWDIAFNHENGKRYIGYDIAADLLEKEFSQLITSPSTKRTTRPGETLNGK